MIQEMAVLSGCDYLASISGVGLKKAHVLINQFKNAKRVRTRAAVFLYSCLLDTL